MLRCFQVQGHSQEAELVELGNEPVQFTYVPRESSGFTPLTAALAHILINDSQVQERLQGENIYGDGALCIDCAAFDQHQAAVSLPGLSSALPGVWASTAGAHPITYTEAGVDAPVQHSLMLEAVPAAPGHSNMCMFPQHDSLPPQHMLPRGVNLIGAAAATDPPGRVQNQNLPVRQGMRCQERHAKGQPPGSFKVPRPSYKGRPIPAHQAHTSRAPEDLHAPALSGHIYHNTEGGARAGLVPYQVDHETAPSRAGFSLASVAEPDPGAELPGEAVLPQPSSVPAGVFHFGCKRPVQISEAALDVGRKLVEKGQWGLVRGADLAASAAAPDLHPAEGGARALSEAEYPQHWHTGVPRADGRVLEPDEALHCQKPLQHEGAGAGHLSKPQEVTHHLDVPLLKAARSVPAASLQAGLAEPKLLEQHVSRAGSEPGQASGGQPDQGRVRQPDQAPSSPDHSACPEHGGFLGSAGIAMSSWGESQVLALPSLAEHREEDHQPSAEADLRTLVPKDILGSQPRAAPAPASPVQDATHAASVLSSQAEPSQELGGAALQPGAALTSEALAAARSTEPGALLQGAVFPQLQCSCVPTQPEAQVALEESPTGAALCRSGPAASATQTASAGATAGNEGAAAQEAQSRPCSATPGHAHASGSVGDVSAPQPGCDHASVGMDGHTPEKECDVHQNRIPVTLAEDAEAHEANTVEDEVDLAVPPTLHEEELQQGQRASVSPEGSAQADLPETAKSTVMMQSQADEATIGSPEGTIPAHLQDTVRELAPSVTVQSQPEEAIPDRDQGSAHTDTREVGHRSARSAEPVSPHQPAMPSGLWSTASGKPLLVSAAALQAAQASFGAGTDFALEAHGHDQLNCEQPAELSGQAAHHSAEPAMPAEQRAVQHALVGDAAGRQPGELPVMPRPSQQELQAELDSRAVLPQLAPAPPVPPAAGQASAPVVAAASIWGTASGKPVQFSKERMRAAAAIFGDDFPIALTPDPPDAAASVTWTSGSGKPLQEPDKEPWQLAHAQGEGGLAAAVSLEADSHPTDVGAAARAGGPGSEPAAVLGVSERYDKNSCPGGAADEAEVTPYRGDAQAHAAMPWHTASGKRMRVSPEALAAAVSKFHPTSGLDHGQSSSRTGAADEAEEVRPRGAGVAEAVVPWQTASGKRMRVSPEALAAAASRLHLTSGPAHGHISSKGPPTLQSGANMGRTAQAASPAEQDVQGHAAAADNGSALDPATPLPQTPAGRPGQLIASTAGRKRSAQAPSGPGPSRARSGSTFKAPRKFMTPVSKFALQQGGRGSTPSRLQQASTAAPRQPLHDLRGSLAGRLLAEAGVASSTHPSDACAHPDQAVLTMTSKSAASFLVTGEDGKQVGAAECMALLHEAGAEPQHCSEAWVANHYRWVVWKLASYERRCPNQLAGHMLTVPVILDQLKYRCEREHGRGHRSVLQKVLEQDERPSRAMILCISQILRPDASAAPQAGGEQVQLEVTDGWYGVRATIDGPLSHYVASKVLRPGMKVRVCGAELRGGQPQTVLEASCSCSLTLHCNGVHRIGPDAKLGWTPYQSVVVPLTAVKAGGGLLPRTSVLVQRRYPPLYWDTLSDGRHIRRTPRAKAGADRTGEAQAEKATEAAVAQIHAEERSHCRQLLAEAKTGNAVKTGALMHANRILSGDSLGAESAQAAAHEDLDEADRYQADRDAHMVKRKEELMQENGAMHVTRSTRFLPLEVSAVLPQGAAEEGQCSMRAVIEVSNPSEDIEGIAEGSCYMVTDLTAPEARRSSASQLLLRTTARTRWQMVPSQEAQAAFAWEHVPRRTAALVDMSPDLEGCAFDYEGIVLGVGDVLSAGGYGAGSQWLFLADDTVGSAEGCSDPVLRPRFLAVQLQAHPEAVDFLSPAADVGSVASLRDLRLRALDTANNVWQADGNEKTAIQLHTLQKCSRATTDSGASLRRLAQWALSNQRLVQSLQTAVQRLMAA